MSSVRNKGGGRKHEVICFCFGSRITACLDSYAGVFRDGSKRIIYGVNSAWVLCINGIQSVPSYVRLLSIYRLAYYIRLKREEKRE